MIIYRHVAPEMKLGALHRVTSLVILYSCFLAQSQALVQRQDCMNELKSCINFFNGNSHPPDSCCQPLDYIIKLMPECLCSLMSIQGANQAEQVGINVTQAQMLPGRCGQHINPLGCVVGTPDTRSRSSVSNSVDSKLGFSSLSSAFIAIAAVLLALHAL
ncbi:hypothetical protein BUALT_Bualt06G0007700 [Buddleja alternifolia]|uniref:Bifunctional inhibitor/plant lipid transfer protein/seed storage helical domain-containing protein n=1 Tax=Buddleja alternifolia TaxID=168488 RepID=A0AAV6XMI8_9LAMI|nr:hypothetical protein BUALT_Bualt06G0007700 [Buddleja alternifolia]